MDHEHDQQHPEQSIDTTRRRLATAGLAAPAVLGVLASRPVLGAVPHHCTPSGYISGFASPNPNATPSCKMLGFVPGHYKRGPRTWPNGTIPDSYFIDSSGKPRLFKDSPQGLGYLHGNPLLYADAYQRYKLLDGTISDATVWDVLAGQPIDSNTGTPLTGWVLQAKPGFNPDLALGAEAVTALMNAILKAPNFPISPGQAVEMFNMVVNGGLYQVTSTNQWNAAEVKAYWQTLHT